MSTEKTNINVQTTINASIEKVWNYWNFPEHITKWCQASPDWHAPKATNDLKVGGRFTTTMAAKDGSFSFDFAGVYTIVELHKRIAYTMDDGRKADITFSTEGNSVKLIETFEAETENTIELQQGGWQAILNSFKAYIEGN
ncbi:SRPBCC family protein [soil metagenome]